MSFLIASSVLLLSLDIGTSMGALVPVQDEGDPWRTSFIFGLDVRYGIGCMDFESSIQFTELQIDPDSSRGFSYSMVPLTLGVGKQMGFLRYGLGPAVYSIEAKLDLAEDLEAVWKGTYGGMYVDIGKDIALGSNTMDFSTRFNIIDFDGLWIGFTASYLF